MRKKRATQKGAQENRDRAAVGMAKFRATGREIQIPSVVDPKRRAKCKKSLRAFYKTYFPNYTYLKPAPYHLEVLEELERCILYGTSKAVAAPRGGGKDTLFGIGVLWAILYGHRHWLVYVAARKSDAVDKLGVIKGQLETNKLLLEDFPEACAPFIALERSPQRAMGQRIKADDGDAYFSRIKYGADEITFATIEGAVCSGARISTAGLDGAIRGMNEGEWRPDFAVVNDGETAASARSEVQRTSRIRIIDQDISGLAGPGKDIAKFLLCTIICPGCIAETYTDKSQRPSWDGKRYAALLEFPKREDLWEKYMEMRREGQMAEDRYGREAHHFYLKNRRAMDAGAQVAWKDRYVSTELDDGEPNEVSALQNIYNQRCDNGDVYFYSEMQNDPLPENENAIGLTPDIVASRVGGYTEGIVPTNAVKLTRGIDGGARELHSTIKAHLSNGDNFVVEYTRIPVEAPEGDLRNPNGVVRVALEEAVLSALRLAKDEVESFPLKDAEGDERHVDLTMVDAGFLEKVVYTFCNESGPRYRPAKGYANAQGQKRYSPPTEKTKRKLPLYQCYASKLPTGQILYHVNADFWKLHTQSRFRQDPGTNGACALWGMDPRKHRSYGKHICAETFDPVTGK